MAHETLTAEPVAPVFSTENLPKLSRDRAFAGMAVTQFLGAFNDNLFKQLVLLICVDFTIRQKLTGDLYQTIAQFLFALPFLLFAGISGFLADKYSKRTIFIWCKVAEIGVMLAAVIVFLSMQMHTLAMIVGLYAVLFTMGTQSTFFGPAKYGILPEMVRSRDLPAANGVIQMTTFLAIIFGTVVAGFSKTAFQENLWIVSGICVGIAALGTLTSFLVRRIPAARPQMKFSAGSFRFSKETWAMVLNDRPLKRVMFVSAFFWLVGGVLLPLVNNYGKKQLQLGDERTSLLAAAIGLGIALGCVLAGLLSRKVVNFKLANLGAWGIVGSCLVLAGLGVSGFSKTSAFVCSLVALISVGIFSGLLAVPLQVFMQSRPPEGQKGQMIALMNFVNWIGILASSGVYLACTFTLALPENPLPVSWTFVVLAAMMLYVALWFTPENEPL